MDDRRRERWADARGIVFRPGDDPKRLEDFDTDFWLAIPVDERMDAVWDLSARMWKLANGGSLPEPGLCRSIASVRRR